MRKLFGAFILAILLLSCEQQVKEAHHDTVKDNNTSTTFSTDTSKLARLINLSTFKPTRAKFKYTFIDNSGSNELLSVPGPSDSYLQAILYFDTTTFTQLKKTAFNANYVAPEYNGQEFDFDWLDPDIRKELSESNTSYHGHAASFLGLGAQGKVWLLDNKILLTKSTD